MLHVAIKSPDDRTPIDALRPVEPVKRHTDNPLRRKQLSIQIEETLQA